MKNQYQVKQTSLDDAESLIKKEHYLRDIFGKYEEYVGHKFYGLFKENDLVGVVQFCCYELEKENSIRHFGFVSDTYEGCWEICRLAVKPQDEHNITSWFLSRAIKMLNPKFIITCADPRMHDGTIYAAINFDYYGLMRERVNGMWNNEFHVFAKSYDDTIKCEWTKKTFDKSGSV